MWPRNNLSTGSHINTCVAAKVIEGSCRANDVCVGTAILHDSVTSFLARLCFHKPLSQPSQQMSHRRPMLIVKRHGLDGGVPSFFTGPRTTPCQPTGPRSWVEMAAGPQALACASEHLCWATPAWQLPHANLLGQEHGSKWLQGHRHWIAHQNTTVEQPLPGTCPVPAHWAESMDRHGCKATDTGSCITILDDSVPINTATASWMPDAVY